MTGREQRAADPFWRSLVLARWTRMRANRAARDAHELADDWRQDNMIERVLLRRRLAEGGDQGERRRHDAGK